MHQASPKVQPREFKQRIKLVTSKDDAQDKQVVLGTAQHEYAQHPRQWSKSSLEYQINAPSKDQSGTNSGVRWWRGMTTITGRMKSGEAATAAASVGTAEDRRLLEESPWAVHLQKGPNINHQ